MNLLLPGIQDSVDAAAPDQMARSSQAMTIKSQAMTIRKSQTR